MFQFSDLVPALESRDLTVVEQSSFFKIARGGKAVYVSKTKRRVTRVDIAGFDVSHEAVRAPAKKNGKVTGQVDCSHEKALDAVVAAFDVLVNGKVEGTKKLPKEKEVAKATSPRKLIPRVTSDRIDEGAAERALAKVPAKWTNGDMEAIAESRNS